MKNASGGLGSGQAGRLPGFASGKRPVLRLDVLGVSNGSQSGGTSDVSARQSHKNRVPAAVARAAIYHLHQVVERKTRSRSRLAPVRCIAALARAPRNPTRPRAALSAQMNEPSQPVSSDRFPGSRPWTFSQRTTSSVATLHRNQRSRAARLAIAECEQPCLLAISRSDNLRQRSPARRRASRYRSESRSARFRSDRHLLCRTGSHFVVLLLFIQAAQRRWPRTTRIEPRTIICFIRHKIDRFKRDHRSARWRTRPLIAV